MALCVLCQQFWLEFACVLTRPALTDNYFQPHCFGCELCTGRHWKGAFDHCCEISDLNFIICCANAELCMCVTQWQITELFSNKHPCMSSAAWTVFCNSHGCTILFLTTCSVTASHSYFPASGFLSFLCPLVISPAAMERSELALQRLSSVMSVIEGRLIQGSTV